MRIHKRQSTALVFRWIILAALLLFTLFPMYWMLTSAFKTPAEISAIPPVFVPRIWSLANFAAALSTSGIGLALRNSVIVAASTTVLSLAFGSAAALGLARFVFRGKVAIQSGIMLAQVVPTTILLVPLFTLWYHLHLYNTLISLIVTYLVFGLPLAAWMLSGYFSTIPIDLEEQAQVDGCSRLEALRRITLPLGLPGVASTAIYVFISSWNEYVIALILTASKATHTYPVFIAEQFGQHNTNWGLIMALATLAMVPAVVLMGFVQRFFVGGLALGGVKA